MSTAARKLLREALRLPSAARGEIVDGLIVSLHQTSDPAVEAAWDAEIARRLRNVESGRTTAIPLREALGRIFEKMRGRRSRR